MVGKRRSHAFLYEMLLLSLILSTVTFTQNESRESLASNAGNMVFNQTKGIVNQTNLNATSNLNILMANQTGTAAQLANLTQEDFEPLTQDLAEARQAFENNDTSSVLDELNSASEELFQIISAQFDPVQVQALTQEFSPLQNHLDQAQEVALKGDYVKTLEHIESAGVELLKITRVLPVSDDLTN